MAGGRAPHASASCLHACGALPRPFVAPRLLTNGAHAAVPPQAMVERQQAENAELGHSHAALHQRMAEKCEASLAEFVAKAEQQLSAVVERHSAEHASFLQQTEGAMPRPKWSSGLLNTRRIEEHLMKQHEFRKAAKVGVHRVP